MHSGNEHSSVCYIYRNFVCWMHRSCLHFVCVQGNEKSNAELGKDPKYASSTLFTIHKAPNPKPVPKVIFLFFLLRVWKLLQNIRT